MMSSTLAEQAQSQTRAAQGASRPGSTESLVDVLVDRAETRPHRVAYAFSDPAKRTTEALSFGELLEDVKGLAAWLQSQGGEGQRCLLLLPPGIDYIRAFIACLMAGVVAVPAYFPDPSRLNRSMPRLMQMLRDAGASFVLTTPALKPLLQPLAVQRNVWSAIATSSLVKRFARLDAPEERLRILAMPSREQAVSTSGWRHPRVGRDSIAFLQYTSGSTNDPKGVVLTHGNLLANLHAICAMFGMDESWRAVIWLPPYHDMGLIGGVLAPLFAGFTTDLMSPITFLQKPLHWLEAISKAEGTKIASGGPNFAYDLCVRRIGADARKKLDLSRWEVAFSGAEPVRHATLSRFAQEFASAGFRYESFLPCYGLAEATLLVTGSKVGDDPNPTFRAIDGSVETGTPVRADEADTSARVYTSSGRVAQDHHVAIVDPERLEARAEGQVGEIWVSGPSVAAGYWNRAEKTREIFEARIGGEGRTYLRTGDLGFFDAGRLFVTGRIKDMIVVGGRKHYPQDIEATVQATDECLRAGCGAAFAIDGTLGESLVIVQEVSEDRLPADTAPLLQRIREEVLQTHDITPAAIVLIRARTLSKTSSGKIQRSAMRAQYEARKLDIVTKWSVPALKGA